MLVSKDSSERPDDALVDVAAWLAGQHDMVGRFGNAIRQSFDEVFDGQRTGRFSLDQLSKVEKTYIGTKVEILVQHEFGLQRGQGMDYHIAGNEVDAKWSIRSGGWMFPTEAMGELCLCLTADDQRSRFSVGLIRAELGRMTASRNKDSKRRLSPEGLTDMTWLAQNATLPENLLLHLEDATLRAVLDPQLSGQRRINELFRRVQERIIRREVVLTVAKQDDGPKRVRDARKHLAQYDLLILGHQGDHPVAARRWGLPVPKKGEWISVSVEAAAESDRRAMCIDDRWVRPVFAGASAGLS